MIRISLCPTLSFIRIGSIPLLIKYATCECRIKSKRLDFLRHSHASYLINLGCAPLLISERLGHEKVQTTLSTYSHLYPNKHQEVVDMMQNQHKLETVAAGASETSDKLEKDPQPQGTRFKVVSPKDKISPQQVHENDLSPCVGFTGRT